MASLSVPSSGISHYTSRTAPERSIAHFPIPSRSLSSSTAQWIHGLRTGPDIQPASALSHSCSNSTPASTAQAAASTSRCLATLRLSRPKCGRMASRTLRWRRSRTPTTHSRAVASSAALIAKAPSYWLRFRPPTSLVGNHWLDAAAATRPRPRQPRATHTLPHRRHGHDPRE